MLGTFEPARAFSHNFLEAMKAMLMSESRALSTETGRYTEAAQDQNKSPCYGVCLQYSTVLYTTKYSVSTAEHILNTETAFVHGDRESVLTSERDFGTKREHCTNFENWTRTSILRQGVAEPESHIKQVCYWCKKLGMRAATSGH